MENAQQRLLTSEQTAKFLQISKRTLERYVKAGYVKPIVIGYSIRFPEDVISAIDPTTFPAKRISKPIKTIK